ncbi:MAG: type II toxin-antitoxin system VapC family toxin [Promethearchaeota archaeon]|jgi:predicted nucleic acid-binding protein
MNEFPKKTKKELLVDSNCWFTSKFLLSKAIVNKFSLVITPIIIYEVIKILEIEINLANQKKKEKRVKLLKELKIRFPNLLNDLDVFIASIEGASINLTDLYKYMEQYSIDIGDAMIYNTMKQRSIETILTNDKDWKRVTGIRIFE